ncbi:unnamed protein product [Orchesella dallaii]|uniref:Gamma-tubulin complex component n=1 Tax=Orchesella dallaii TaxID=48710 RepID=A0ABP1PS70_9HEXA
MILKVQGQSRSSALIVEVVKAEYDSNVHLQDTLKKLIPWVNRILYNQIINWVVFGSLHDPTGEFFVKQNRSDVDSVDASGKPSHSKHSAARPKNHEKYIVDYAVVPSHFSVPLTDRILYIGASIGILSNSEKTKSSIVLKQKQFYEELKNLPIETFRVEELSEVIEGIAIEVGKDLHHLVVAETDLPKHLGIIKDFYLTGRGELFHDFLLNLKTVPMAKNSLLSDVSQAFILAATRVQVQDEILQRIHIQLPSDIAKPKLELVMSSMSLRMEDEWPLHILFSPESLRKYNELFRFLLQVRLLQIDLSMIWLNTRRVFRFPVPRGPAELRNVMSYFIDHLQHYLQEDVLENQFAILTNAIEKSENFDQILVAHAQFQSNILAQSFRSSKQLRHFLDEIIKVCSNYVAFINNHIQTCETKDLPVNEGISKEVSDISVNFFRHMDLLLNLLKNLALNPQSGQYLGQFLLRLDFNSYFSSTISGFNV